MAALMIPKKLSGAIRKNEVSPSIVQLGASLPSRFPDVTDMWIPVKPETEAPQDVTMGPAAPLITQGRKSPRYKNLYEYDKRHGGQCHLQRNLWKNPNLSSNLLPVSKVSVEKNKMKREREQSGPSLLKDLFSRIESTPNLPPISGTRTHRMTNWGPTDISNLKEKKYISQQLKPVGPIETFARDSVYLPQVYPQCYTCKECRKSYITEVFAQNRAKNNRMSQPGHVGESAVRSTNYQCEVLGERYCSSCIEVRNKRFSRQIEEGLLRKDHTFSQLHWRHTR